MLAGFRRQRAGDQGSLPPYTPLGLCLSGVFDFQRASGRFENGS